MYIRIDSRRAAQILVSGGHVWDGNDPWAGCICELSGLRRGKSCRTRELRKWTRWCARHQNDWFVYEAPAAPSWFLRANNPDDVGFNIF